MCLEYEHGERNDIGIFSKEIFVSTLKLLSFLIFCLTFMNSAQAQLQTVPYVELSKYAGTWYQIAHKPLNFEGPCVCSRQVLTPIEDGSIAVYNTCNEPTTGVLRSIAGFAYNNDPATNAQFTVDFGLPKMGQYWIIGLGDNYEYAVVSDPAFSSLYILSKTPQLAAELYEEALEKAKAQMDVSKLRVTEQRNCFYPAL